MSLFAEMKRRKVFRALLEYGHWLKLQVGAEPSVASQVEAVRAEVARLEGLHSVSTVRTP